MKSLLVFKSITFCILAGVVSLLPGQVMGQMENYNYKRSLSDIQDTWHKISLPTDIAGNVNSRLTDIRIYGVTKTQDTIEAPYILNILSEQVVRKEIPFNLINQTHNKNGYFYTYEINTPQPINQIKLDFNTKNFEWRLQLEGSHNQKDWFTLVEDYRILSIKNELTNYQFTTVKFPFAKYTYYRLRIKSETDPGLKRTAIASREVTPGHYHHYPIQSLNTTDDKVAKKSNTIVAFDKPVLLNHLRIKVNSDFDYYRPFSIRYAMDSTKVTNGWRYNYKTLAQGTLSSMEENNVSFNPTTAKRLNLVIHNHDNQPLVIDSIFAKGYQHELTARFTAPGDYYLVYGNKKARAPVYDIKSYVDKIPKTLKPLKVGAAEKIDPPVSKVVQPLFENKWWLWGIMIIIIGILGWFSLKMIQDK